MILCAIEKSEKRDMTSPRFYRLISLLLVLGKELERIVAKRLGWIAIRKGILPKIYFFAILLRSAVNYAILLTDEVQQA